MSFRSVRLVARASVALAAGALLASYSPYALAEGPAPATEKVPEVVIEAPKPEPGDERGREVAMTRRKLRDETARLANAEAELRALQAAAAQLALSTPSEPRARELARQLAELDRELSDVWQLAARVESFAARGASWLAQRAKAAADPGLPAKKALQQQAARAAVPRG